MSEKIDLAGPMLVSCQVCQHEIPLSEAVVPEAADYVAHFCSLDCYASWLARAGEFYAPRAA